MRWPDGLASPNRIAATADPSVWPGYQASSTAGTWLSQGMLTGEPVSRTTIVLGFAAAVASISWSWLPPMSRLVRSSYEAPPCSHSSSLANTMATEELAASSAAALMLDPSA